MSEQNIIDITAVAYLIAGVLFILFHRKRLLFWLAHRERGALQVTGQLALPNQDAVFCKRAAFFNSLKSKVGHIMAKASALRVNMNLPPTVLSTSRARTSTSHAPLLYALNLSHQSCPPIAHNARE